MKPSRREFIENGGRAVVALGLGACAGTEGADSGFIDESSPDRSPEPEPWAAPGEEDLETFPGGVQLGDAQPDAVQLSLLTESSELSLVLMRAQDFEWVEDREQSGLLAEDGRLALEIDGLEADTAYSLAIYAEDGQSRSTVARFRTALAADSSRKIVFGATSCMKYNQPWPGLSGAASESLDFFVLLGDTIYASGSTLEQYQAEWATALRTQGLRDLSASTSLVASWDDHEVANNWSMEQVGEERYLAALQAFREAIPQTMGQSGTLWRSLRWGRSVEVFVLDCRAERGDGLYISTAQMDWLKAGLIESAARFKIICNSVPITDLTGIFGQAEADDRWQGHPEQREEILSYIEDEDIEGVLWITGDFHYGQIGNLSPAGEVGDGGWEILCGPTGSSINAAAVFWVGGVDQYLDVIADHNWVRFECDPVEGTIRVQHISDEGEALSDRVLEL